MYRQFHLAIQSLYGETINLESEDYKDFEKKTRRINLSFDKAVRHIHTLGEYKPTMLTSDACSSLTNSFYNLLKDAVETISIKQEIPAELTRALENNIFFFSAFKTNSELQEASTFLKDGNGGIKPFERFYNDIKTLRDTYNKNYLYAEYNFATSSAQMAVKWQDFTKDKDRYNLQYRTANDNRVREEHRLLEGTTLPIGDKFWESYFPPNGWNCRCTVVQVRKDKYPESDSALAIKRGDNATNTTKKKIFRFNPGAKKTIFPPKHPYYKTSDEAKKIIANTINPIIGANTIASMKDLSKSLEAVASTKDWFKNGYVGIRIETNYRRNGSTNMQGTISLRKSILDNCITAFEKIRTNKDLTYEEERSMSTLWHEITHNRHKLQPNEFMSKQQRRFMECANEFVQRKTINDEFFKSLGTELKNKGLETDRDNCGYNDWVVNYEKAINQLNLDINQVVAVVKKHLFNEKYNNQFEGLVKGLMINGSITNFEARQMVLNCFN